MDISVFGPWDYGTPAILLVDLDAFFASVEQLDHPGWRGKPVIVGGDSDKRGVVATASYEARKYGVRSAMPSSQATRLCPDAIWTHGHYDRYKEMSRKVMSILSDESPFLQQVSIDEAFLDVTPTKLNPEHPAAIADRIQRRVSELGISCSVGVGTTKSIAKIASDMDKPHGLTVVMPGAEEAFLAPLPVRTLSGIGASTEKELHKHGIYTLGELSKCSEIFMKRHFGKNGIVLLERAKGLESSSVESDDEVKSVSNEISFAEDISSAEDVHAAMYAMAAKVCRRLRAKQLKGKTLSLKVRFSNRAVKSSQCQLRIAADDESVLMGELERLLEQIWRPGTPIRLLGVGMSHFTEEGPIQGSLFSIDDDSEIYHEEYAVKKRADLHRTADAVKDRFGEKAVRFGAELRNENNVTGTGEKNPSDYK